MGPVCQIALDSVASEDDLFLIDGYLVSRATDLVSSRKGRHWEGWIEGRPFLVSVVDEDDSEGRQPAVKFAAMCNRDEDYVMLSRLSTELAHVLGRQASEPIK